MRVATQALGALIGGAVPLAVSPYLARLNLTVPDKDEARWWRGRQASPAATAVTAAVAAVLGVLGGLAAGASLTLIPFVALAIVGAPLIVIDFVHHKLPNRLVFPLAVIAPLLALIPAAAGDRWSDYGRAAAGAAAVLAVLFVLAFVAPRGFGYGDVKLGGILGGYLGWFGWAEVYYGIFGGFLLGAAVSLVLLATRRANMKTKIPFGPMLLVGALVVLAFDLVPRL